jgi:hypothetical protein
MSHLDIIRIINYYTKFRWYFTYYYYKLKNIRDFSCLKHEKSIN